MFLRLLIFVVVVVLVYRAAKKWFGPDHSLSSGDTGAPPQSVDDEMIRDPECGIYFPQRSAVALDQRHQVLYFCSTECRDRYLARHSSEAPQ
jgi:uncharacterized protein